MKHTRMPTRRNIQRPLRAKLMLNPIPGRSEDPPPQLVELLNAMQAQEFLPEVYKVDPDSDAERVVHEALRAGVRWIVGGRRCFGPGVRA